MTRNSQGPVVAHCESSEQSWSSPSGQPCDSQLLLGSADGETSSDAKQPPPWRPVAGRSAQQNPPSHPREPTQGKARWESGSHPPVEGHVTVAAEPAHVSIPGSSPQGGATPHVEEPRSVRLASEDTGESIPSSASQPTLVRMHANSPMKRRRREDGAAKISRPQDTKKPRRRGAGKRIQGTDRSWATSSAALVCGFDQPVQSPSVSASTSA